MLSHFDDTFADGLYVTPVAERGLAKSCDQSALRRLVVQALESGIEFGQGLDDVHA
jgi:hypothetical protein